MRILLLGFTKLARMPYARLYTEALAARGHELHVVFWNRDGRPESLDDVNVHQYHEFRRIQEDEAAKITKVRSFLRYRRFVRRVIHDTQVDMLVVLHTMPGLTLLDMLIMQFRGRYLLDFRDLTMEWFLPFRVAVGRLAAHSAAVFISSEAFRRFLPRGVPVYSSPNLDRGLLSLAVDRSDVPRAVDTIRVRFWGLVRHEVVNRSIVNGLGGDDRFELHYHGSGWRTADRLQRLAVDRGYTNVHFHGSYLPEDRYSFGSKTDLVLNVYENDFGTSHAMSNKYYDALALRVPQVCTADSFMGGEVARAGVGLCIDPTDDTFPDQLVAFYEGLCWQRFEEACEEELRSVEEAARRAAQAVVRIVSDAGGGNPRLDGAK